MGMFDFQALVRDGDHIVYDFVQGTIHSPDSNNWWGSFQIPRNSDPEVTPESGQYYQLSLKDGRTGVIIVDQCLLNVHGRYPTVQFHGTGPLE